MSMHKTPLTTVEKEGLERHRLPIGAPSQLSDCFRLGVAWGLKQPSSVAEKNFEVVNNWAGESYVQFVGRSAGVYSTSTISKGALEELVDKAREPLLARIRELEALSVTNIMLDVVPGDGSGFEVYAKSVDEVVNKLSELDSELEDWQLGIKKHSAMTARIAELDAKVRCEGLIHGWITDWPKGSGGTAPVYTAGPNRPSYGAELDAVLNIYPVYTAAQREGKVTLTRTPDGELVAVTRQDDEGRILSVIWERGPKSPTSRPPEEKREPYRCKLIECLGKVTCGPCAVMFDGAVKELTPRPMETAPRDGTIIRLLVQFEDHPLIDDNSKPMWTIGGNTFDNTGQDPDLWQFAGWDWTHDRFTEGTGKPVGWLPLI